VWQGVYRRIELPGGHHANCSKPYPDARRIYWKWVGGMFVLCRADAHRSRRIRRSESSRKLAQQPVTTVAIDGKQRSIGEVPAPVRQAARY
jgi:hypothetical protein